MATARAGWIRCCWGHRRRMTCRLQHCLGTSAPTPTSLLQWTFPEEQDFRNSILHSLHSSSLSNNHLEGTIKRSRIYHLSCFLPYTRHWLNDPTARGGNTNPELFCSLTRTNLHYILFKESILLWAEHLHFRLTPTYKLFIAKKTQG